MDKLTLEQRSALRDCGEAIKTWWQEPAGSRESFDRGTRAMECINRLLETFANPNPNGKTPDWAKDNPEVKPPKKPGKHVN